MIAGEFRLLEVRGAGCAPCGEPNVRYGYDDAGRLTETTRLSEIGEPVATIKAERDKLGRVTRVSKIAYRNGKPDSAQLQVRFGYPGNDFAPTLAARPSVVLGRELVTRIDYNGAGQPLSVTENGWVPTADGKQVAARIARTIRYRYAIINGRSLLTEIDGPLANGKTNSPADSDVTVFEYDHRPAPAAAAPTTSLVQYDRRDGQLTRVIAPGNLVTEIVERDAALRPTRLRTTDGDVVQEIGVTSNWRGAPLHLELAARTLRRKVDYEYNSFGELAAVTMPGNLRTTFAYDSAGRRSVTVLPDGSGMRSEQDTEDRVVRTTRLLDALDAGGAGLSDLRFTYDRAEDKPGKLAEVGDTAGLIKRYSYDELGRISAVHSALGIATAFAYDATGLLASRTDAAGSADAASIGLVYDPSGNATGITAGNGVKTLRRYDDFGRKVMEVDPDHGITLFRHDAADHTVGRIDESLVATRFTYDHAGRLLAMGADKEPSLVQYRYRGRQLQGVISTPDGKPEHATERTDYEHDALGRVATPRRLTVELPAGLRAVCTPVRMHLAQPPQLLFSRWDWPSAAVHQPHIRN